MERLGTWTFSRGSFLCGIVSRRCRQRNDSEHARADALADGLDDAALARRVAPLEDDDDARALRLDPLLERAQLGLELAQLLHVLFRGEVGWLVLRLVFGHVLRRTANSGTVVIASLVGALGLSAWRDSRSGVDARIMPAIRQKTAIVIIVAYAAEIDEGRGIGPSSNAGMVELR